MRRLLIRLCVALALIGSPVGLYAHWLGHIEHRSLGQLDESGVTHACELCAAYAVFDGAANASAAIVTVASVTTRRLCESFLTPALHELRTIQDHNEVDHLVADGITQLPTPSPRLPRSPYLSGVVR